MVNGGNLNFRFEKIDVVRLQSYRQEVKIRSVIEQILMNAQVIRYVIICADLYLTMWFCDVIFQWVMKFYRTDFQRTIVDEFIFQYWRQQVRQRLGDLRFRREVIRRWRGRYCFLMFEIRFWCLERGSYIKNRFVVLNSSNSAGVEVVIVTQRFDIINNRFFIIVRAKKVVVKRMYQSFFRDGFFCSI